MELKKATLWERLFGVCYTENEVNDMINREVDHCSERTLNLLNTISGKDESIKKLDLELTKKTVEINDLKNENSKLIKEKKDNDCAGKLKTLQNNLTKTIADYKEQLKNVKKEADNILRKANTDAANKMIKLSKEIDKLKNKKSSEHGKKLGCPEAKEIRKLHDSGMEQSDIAEKYNVSDSTINRIVNNKTYKECV